ncbi:crotonobetainyl-CoA--carnitine CoA-transferase [Zobellella sp. An-6]|uniref:crotonobetainyl-CoA--carnitine CoA-transferase n=1 Tax=Zobellella sp. An-6 TaxID=3400218 RepID=UPI004042415E
MKNDYGIKSSANEHYTTARVELSRELRNSPIPDAELTANIGLYTERMHLSRILLMHDLYKQIINVPGIVMELGVRWGQNMSLFSAFRGMYEPYNYTRKVVGFDTFSGFPAVSEQDGLEGTELGDYNVTDGWKKRLEGILSHHESMSPLPHIKKWEIVEGDANITLPDYIEHHPELIVALAYFDFDIYMPTKLCLEKLIPRLTKGSIVVFDELNCPAFPGETVAVQEVLGINKIELRRDTNNPYVSWFKW